MSAQPGRNDPCWCGSGTKYKKCHLRSDEALTLARAREISETRREIAAHAHEQPPASTPRVADPLDERHAEYERRWAEADLDERLALFRQGVEGEEAAGEEWVFEAASGLIVGLREAGRLRDLIEALDLVRTRRADCMDAAAGFYLSQLAECTLAVGALDEDLLVLSARDILLDEVGENLLALLAFRGETAMIVDVFGPALRALRASIAEREESAEEEAVTSDDDEAELERARDLFEASVYLHCDVEVGHLIATRPDALDEPAQLHERVSDFIEVDAGWIERVAAMLSGREGPPPESALASADEDAATDAVVLTTYAFLRWFEQQVDWNAGRRALSRSCLGDALLVHVGSLRRLTRRSLLLSAQTLLNFASDAEQSAVGVALLTVGAWWNAWLAEQKWVSAVDVSRELRRLRRDWPTIIGHVGTPGGDPVLTDALRSFWTGFPSRHLDPAGSLPPPPR